MKETKICQIPIKLVCEVLFYVVTWRPNTCLNFCKVNEDFIWHGTIKNDIKDKSNKFPLSTLFQSDLEDPNSI